MIYPKYKSKSRRETAARKRVAERPQPADGIERRKSKLTGEELEFCVTPEATKRRRLQVWMQASGQCQGDDHRSGFHSLGYAESDSWHWHHKKFRSQGGDDSLKNALALCVSCHAKEHGVGNKNLAGVRTERTGRFQI